jgi:hypothetical protein
MKKSERRCKHLAALHRAGSEKQLDVTTKHKTPKKLVSTKE